MGAQVKRTFRLLGVWVAVLVACGCASRPAGQVANRPQQRLEHVAGIENFGFVSSEVWRGARPTAQGYQTLRDMGVRTVIDLELPGHVPLCPPELNPRSLPVSGFHADRVDTAALLALIRQSPKPIFIHCRQGRDRTGIAVAAYRVACGMPLADVIAELHRFGVNLWWAPLIEHRIHEMSGLMAAAK
jgi:tyrosine-protein phosphatase SIW14